MQTHILKNFLSWQCQELLAGNPGRGEGENICWINCSLQSLPGSEVISLWWEKEKSWLHRGKGHDLTDNFSVPKIYFIITWNTKIAFIRYLNCLPGVFYVTIVYTDSHYTIAYHSLFSDTHPANSFPHKTPATKPFWELQLSWNCWGINVAKECENGYPK